MFKKERTVRVLRMWTGIDFKLRAVQLSNQPGVLIKDMAESLCIPPFMLSKWRKRLTFQLPPNYDTVITGELEVIASRARYAVPAAALSECLLLAHGTATGAHLASLR